MFSRVNTKVFAPGLPGLFSTVGVGDAVGSVDTVGSVGSAGIVGTVGTAGSAGFMGFAAQAHSSRQSSPGNSRDNKRFIQNTSPVLNILRFM
jgi:hypothetical protein